MNGEELDALLAENERLHAYASTLEDRLAHAPRFPGHSQTGDLLGRELSRKAALLTELCARGSAFSFAEGLRAAADVLSASAQETWRHGRPARTATAELLRTPRRVLQTFFEHYGQPETPATRRTRMPRRTA
jgi:hypothetical protein